MKNIIITILAILVLGLGGYLVYDKVLDKDVKEEVKEESSKQESKNFDLAEAKKLVDKYSLDTPFMHAVLQNGMTEENKVILTILNSEPSNINYTCNDAFTGKTYELEMCVNESNRAYAYESLNKTYKELFGNQNDLPKKLVSTGVSSYSYSEKYDAYIFLSSAGGYGPSFRYYDVDNAVEKDDTLEVIINYVLGKLGDDEKSIYIEDTNINVPIVDSTNVTDEEMKTLYNKALSENKTEKYKFIFKKSDNGYYLDSIIKVVY